MRAAPTVRILGIPVDAVSPDDAVDRVVDRVTGSVTPDGEGASFPFRIVAANANKAWLADREPSLRDALESADLVIPEWAMVWAARHLDREPLEFVGGVTLMRQLLEEADRRRWSVYLLGAGPGVASRLARRLEEELPGLEIAGHHHGYLSETADKRVRAEVRDLQPDLLFVGMGSPRQERWIFRDGGPEGAAVAMGVGGSFDVLVGDRREAPSWIRATGFEWLWRTAQDPWRLGRRYAVVNPWFVGKVIGERAREAFRPAPPGEDR